MRGSVWSVKALGLRAWRLGFGVLGFQDLARGCRVLVH